MFCFGLIENKNKLTEQCRPTDKKFNRFFSGELNYKLLFIKI